MSFTPEYLFTKGICYAEFFDPSTDALLAYSEYVTDFSVSGSINTGEISGGPGNMLIMCVPDSARIAITARTADSALRSMALASGGELSEGGIVETSKWIDEASGALTLTGAVAPKGGFNGPVCYILSSTGSDRETVRASSGTAHGVSGGTVQDFTPITGASYLVRYFKQVSGAGTLRIPSLFEPRVVRAHFAVNCYAKKTGEDVMLSSLYKIRHYYFPYYYFTGALNDSLSQTEHGTVDLSGSCLVYEAEDASGTSRSYGYIVDEPV